MCLVDCPTRAEAVRKLQFRESEENSFLRSRPVAARVRTQCCSCSFGRTSFRGRPCLTEFSHSLGGKRKLAAIGFTGYYEHIVCREMRLAQDRMGIHIYPTNVRQVRTGSGDSSRTAAGGLRPGSRRRCTSRRSPTRRWLSQCRTGSRAMLCLSVAIDLFLRPRQGPRTGGGSIVRGRRGRPQPRMTTDQALQALLAAFLRRKPKARVMGDSDLGSKFTSREPDAVPRPAQSRCQHEHTG
jgi:hypothetical protein